MYDTLVIYEVAGSCRLKHYISQVEQVKNAAPYMFIKFTVLTLIKSNLGNIIPTFN